MTDLKAEVFPDRVELEVVDSEPPVTTIAAMAAFSDHGLTLTVSDSASIEAFRCGTRVRAGYGDHSGFCQFDSEVVEAWAGSTPGDPGTIRLRPPKQVSTIQRRKFVRADVDLTIPCTLLDNKAMTWLSAPGEVANLGGGGLMMIIARHPSLAVGSRLALALPLPGGDPVLALGRAVQVIAEPDGPATVRLAFTAIDAVDRERVERYAYRRLGGSAPARLWSSGKITKSRP